MKHHNVKTVINQETGETFTPVFLDDSNDLVEKIKENISFIRQFDDPIIGFMCLENGISIERAIAAGVKMKKGNVDESA